MNDLGNPRQTGFYAGALDNAQKNGTPLHAVAFRRSSTSLIEIVRLACPGEAGPVMSKLVMDGVATNDMWPIIMFVGQVGKVTVEALMPVVKEPDK